MVEGVMRSTQIHQGPMNEPELQRIARELDDATTRARSLCAGLDDEQLGWSARPGAWSIAEILRHLEITTDVFLPGLDEAVTRARRRGRLAPGPYGLSAWGRLLVWYVEPPPPIRLPAPRPLRPTLQSSPREALERFIESQGRFATWLPRLEGIDLARASYVSPIARYIRMSLLAFLRVHTAHERRHLWQADNVRRLLQARGQAGPTLP
ncbi:MAG: DinB family protein [Vicinamibacteria bacterium]